MQHISNTMQMASDEAQRLTGQMDEIFNKYKGPQCEAPEFMPEAPRKEWDRLHKLRTDIRVKLHRVEAANSELYHFLMMEVL